MKYRYKAADGRPRDETVEDTWQRVAKAIAKAEPKQRRASVVDHAGDTARVRLRPGSSAVGPSTGRASG